MKLASFAFIVFLNYAPNNSFACEHLLAQHWPGALTVIVQQKKHFPKEISSDGTIALRMPNHTLALSIIEKCGGALAVSSANLSGQPPARSAEEARRIFERKRYVESGHFFRPEYIHIVDGGVTVGGTPSTVVDCTHEPFRTIREGPIRI
jgi:L-threonylcarbamoyladenylate synthase